MKKEQNIKSKHFCCSYEQERCGSEITVNNLYQLHSLVIRRKKYKEKQLKSNPFRLWLH